MITGLLHRITRGWTFIRAVYVVFGAAVIYMGVAEGQWVAAALGAYFASMGLLNLGCAAGACYNPVSKPGHLTHNSTEKEISYEEVIEKKYS
ncbi:MAG: hypothetical protein NZM35_04875 [Chitinophagales bacterium]|nr:hypothetical protein [Chitinophagales bacterium]MDW8419215.1 hypothetical protein [Chitinophagales bacterium]